jgi:hypothetical protein
MTSKILALFFTTSALSCGLACAQSVEGAGQGQQTAAQGTPIEEEFAHPWPSATSPDGKWRIAGPWKGTGGNMLLPQNITISPEHNGVAGGFALLTSKANTMVGAELQSITTQGFGYYETRLRVTDVPGVCTSFFWIQAPKYGPLELDVEFLTNEPWINSENSGKVHFFIHPANINQIVDLPFNPSKEFHSYGFLWTPGTIAFTVDKKVVHTIVNDTLNLPSRGFIMMNSWTGNKDWGGGPPDRDATTVYDWVKYYPGATKVLPSPE